MCYKPLAILPTISYLCGPFRKITSLAAAPPFVISLVMSVLLDFINAEGQERRASFPDFAAGDTINVHVKIREGNKERIQQFQGVVLQRRNPSSNGETFTVRKISNQIGTERIFPLLSPNIEKIEVVRRGKVRRARLFYLRGLSGKQARIKERRLNAVKAA
jgi:large subunit ribosomal protein L19